MCSLDFVGYHHTLSVPIPVLVGGIVINAELQTHIQDDNLFNQCTPSHSLDVQPDWYRCSLLPRRDEGSDKPSATIEPHRIMVKSQTRTQAAGLKVRCRYHYYHYTTAAHATPALAIVDLSVVTWDSYKCD